MKLHPKSGQINLTVCLVTSIIIIVISKYSLIGLVIF